MYPATCEQDRKSIQILANAIPIRLDFLRIEWDNNYPDTCEQGLSYLNVKVANFNNLRLFWIDNNRCQSLCQKGFVCFFFNKATVQSMFKHVAFENGPLVLIFIVKYID